MAQPVLNSDTARRRGSVKPWRGNTWEHDDNDDDQGYTRGWDDVTPRLGLIKAISVPLSVSDIPAVEPHRDTLAVAPVGNDIPAPLAQLLLSKLSALSRETLQRIAELDTNTLTAVLADPINVDDGPPDEDVDIDTYLAPWATSEEVQQLLGVENDELESLVQQAKLIGLRFNDGKLYFPARQFTSSGPLPGLQEVVEALQPTLETPQSIALWLTGVVDEDAATTMWDLMHQGKVEEVLSVAADDLAYWES